MNKKQEPIFYAHHTISRSLWGDGRDFGHVRFSFVYLNEDDGLSNFGDRHYDAKEQGALLANLYASGMYNRYETENGKPKNEIYGFSLEYRQVYSLDLEEAEWMVKTLRRAHRIMKNLEGQFGHPTTFGQYCQRVAHVFKVKEIYVTNLGYGSAYDSRKHIIYGIDNIDGAIWQAMQHEI